MAKSGFKGGGFGGGMSMNMLRQAQKMQQDMIKAQEEIETQTYTATSGGGMVTASVNGKRELTSLTINPEAVDPEDVEMLTDMVMAAINEALRKAETAMSQGMSKVTGGLGNLNFNF